MGFARPQGRHSWAVCLLICCLLLSRAHTCSGWNSVRGCTISFQQKHPSVFLDLCQTSCCGKSCPQLHDTVQTSRRRTAEGTRPLALRANGHIRTPLTPFRPTLAEFAAHMLIDCPVSRTLEEGSEGVLLVPNVF